MSSRHHSRRALPAARVQTLLHPLQSCARTSEAAHSAAHGVLADHRSSAPPPAASDSFLSDFQLRQVGLVYEGLGLGISCSICRNDALLSGVRSGSFRAGRDAEARRRSVDAGTEIEPPPAALSAACPTSAGNGVGAGGVTRNITPRRRGMSAPVATIEGALAGCAGIAAAVSGAGGTVGTRAGSAAGCVGGTCSSGRDSDPLARRPHRARLRRNAPGCRMLRCRGDLRIDARRTVRGGGTRPQSDVASSRECRQWHSGRARGRAYRSSASRFVGADGAQCAGHSSAWAPPETICRRSYSVGTAPRLAGGSARDSLEPRDRPASQHPARYARPGQDP